jgi:hypothetical protein
VTGPARRVSAARVVLLCTLLLTWLNLLLTRRWADVPGALNGRKFPYVVAALVVTSLLAWRARPARIRLHAATRIAGLAALVFLLIAFFRWFPLAAWSAIPFLDDWPPRYQSTIESVRLLNQGPFVGWQWNFLGGYPMSTDVTQDLAVWCAIPMALLGPPIGFHLTHLLLFLAIPALVWVDLRLAGERRDVCWLATAFAALFAASYGYLLIRSGDTNSIAGAVSALGVLVAAHAARKGVRGGSVALLVTSTVAYNSHRGFFVYAGIFLFLDAALSRDWRSAARAGIGIVAAIAMSLPRTWDLWLHPSFYIVNNVELHPRPIVWGEFFRKIYYNLELLVQPGRWLNDATGLATVSLPIAAFVCWKGPRRIRFYAAATIGVMALIRLNHSAFGYAFIRPVYLLPIFLAPMLAWFVLRCTGSRALAGSLLASFALYIQIWLGSVPHVADVHQFDPTLIARIEASKGDLVLLENNFHRDVDIDPARESLPTRFGIHYEALIPEATGRRLYAGMWDGWQWTPDRDQVFANGTFRGRALSDVVPNELLDELRRWNVRHLFVWSDPAKQFLASIDGLDVVWRSETWQEFQWNLEEPGTPRVLLHDRDPFSADVSVMGAVAGERIPVPTNYHPAWRAYSDQGELPLLNVDGQLAFVAPSAGDFVVTLAYPQPLWTVAVTVLSACAALALLMLVSRRSRFAPAPTR